MAGSGGSPTKHLGLMPPYAALAGCGQASQRSLHPQLQLAAPSHAQMNLCLRRGQISGMALPPVVQQMEQGPDRSPAASPRGQPGRDMLGRNTRMLLSDDAAAVPARKVANATPARVLHPTVPLRCTSSLLHLPLPATGPAVSAATGPSPACNGSVQTCSAGDGLRPPSH